MRFFCRLRMSTNTYFKFCATAFTLVELLLVVVFLGILTAIAVPRFNMASVHTQMDKALACKLTADLRKTRMIAVADAADNSSGYKLQINTHTPKSYQIINLKTGQILETHSVDGRISFSGTTQFSFTPLGALNPAANVQLTMTGENKSWLFEVYGSTGSVQCTEQ